MPAGLLGSPDIDPEGRLNMLDPLDLQLLLVPAGRLLSLGFHLKLGPGLLELLDQGLFVSRRGELTMMTSLPQTFAKSKRAGFLTEVKKQVATLKAICNDPVKQEQDRLSTVTPRKAETCQ